MLGRNPQPAKKSRNRTLIVPKISCIPQLAKAKIGGMV